MLLTPQHRRSARVAARMQKTAQQEFNERVANGTMTKEELLNAPTCFRSFDEAEDAILAQSDEESEEETNTVPSALRLFLDGRVLQKIHSLKLIVSKLPVPLVSAIIQQLIQELEEAQALEEAQKRRREKRRGRRFYCIKTEEETSHGAQSAVLNRLLARR